VRIEILPPPFENLERESRLRPMHDTQLVMYDEDYRRILAVIQRLVRDANAKGIFVVDRNGQMIGEAGEMRGIDTTSLASLTAGCIAATGGLAKIVGEEEFPVHFHQGARDNLHITLIASRIILVVVFDDRSSLGLVRLRVKKAGVELAKIFEDLQKKAERAEARGGGTPFAEITDEDIDNLFSN
jgi:predicted regulator of Ras-like GTPase activity (Roadblock/LC7/MglB family)